MMSGEMLKGHLDALLLAAVEARAAHGYAILEELRQRSGGAFDLPEGTVYPALHRLERAGLLESAWSADTGRRRRVYALTKKGRAALARSRNDWRQFSDGVNAVLGGYPCTNPA
jgi:DNA-binding PadR family transcriptional regulator